jgi:hypothetical protein
MDGQGGVGAVGVLERVVDPAVGGAGVVSNFCIVLSSARRFWRWKSYVAFLNSAINSLR